MGGYHSLLRFSGTGMQRKLRGRSQIGFFIFAQDSSTCLLFFPVFQTVQMLIVEETSREASMRGSPNRRASILFLVQADIGDLDRIGVPGGSIWIHNRRLRTPAIHTKHANAGFFDIAKTHFQHAELHWKSSNQIPRERGLERTLFPLPCLRLVLKTAWKA